MESTQLTAIRLAEPLVAGYGLIGTSRIGPHAAIRLSHKPVNNRFFTLVVFIIVLIAGPTTSAAQDAGSDNTSEAKEGSMFSPANFDLRLGSYYIASTTEIRVDALDGLIGTSIDLEDDLNLDDRKAAPYFALSWRMSGNHFLELEQFNLTRSGDQTLIADINFGDQAFLIGAMVNSYFDTKVTRVSYAYKIYDTERSTVAVSAGIHRTKLTTGIEEVSLQPLEDRPATAEVTAPLPVIGAAGVWKFNEQWSVAGRAQIFRLTIAEYSGRLDHISVHLDYDPFKYVGFGVGYDLFSINLDVEKKQWQGSVRYRFNGPMLYLKGHF